MISDFASVKVADVTERNEPAVWSEQISHRESRVQLFMGFVDYTHRISNVFL